MSNRYRGSSIDASYQVSVHWTKRFQRRNFLEIDQSETRIACGSHVCLRIGTNEMLIFTHYCAHLVPNGSTYNKGRRPYNCRLSDFSFYIDSQISVHGSLKQ